MPRLRHLLTLTLGTALLHLPSVQAAEELPAAIKKIEAKGAKIVGQFDAPDGLRGYAAQYQNRGMALYLTPDGKHVVVGNLYDADGKDLSSEPLQKLVYAPMSKEVWAKFEASNWIQDGNKDAPRTVYLFSDPNCPTATCSGNRRGHGSRQAKCSCATSWSASSAKTARANQPRCWRRKTRPRPCKIMRAPVRAAPSRR